MERYDPTIKPVKSNADGRVITSIPMESFHSPWTSIGKVDRIEWYFILPKARALTVTCGRCERLSPYQRHDLMRIWTYALGESSYEPKIRQAYAVMKHLGIISYERKVSIEQDMRVFFLHDGTVCGYVNKTGDRRHHLMRNGSRCRVHGRLLLLRSPDRAHHRLGGIMLDYNTAAWLGHEFWASAYEEDRYREHEYALDAYAIVNEATSTVFDIMTEMFCRQKHVPDELRDHVRKYLVTHVIPGHAVIILLACLLDKEPFFIHPHMFNNVSYEQVWESGVAELLDSYLSGIPLEQVIG